MSMSLKSWCDDAWLTEHQTSRQEIADLLNGADRDLADCGAGGLSLDWRLAIAHNAVILLATAALAAYGYRAGREAQHYRLIQSLAHTIGAERPLVTALDRYRKKRNISGYQRPGAVSEKDADEILALARDLRDRVRSWLAADHPELT
jgi:hypothetical protein